MTRSNDELQTISDMRDLLDFIETHPELPMPYLSQIDAFGLSRNLAAHARALSPCDKTSGEAFFVLSRTFGSATYRINFNHKMVCEAVVVGTEDVPEKVIPAHTKDIIEWKCPDSILETGR